MLTTKQSVAAWLVLAAAAMTTVGQAHGQRAARGQRTPEVRGAVKTVDAAARTITISIAERREPVTEKTYPLAKDLEIGLGNGGGRGRQVGFKEGQLADLPAGAQVTLVLSADEKAVECILAEGPTLRGQLSKVDLTQNTIAVTVPSGREVARGEAATPEEKSYPLAAGAEIAVDDGRGRSFSIKEGKLADLTMGSPVTLRLSVDQKHVQAVLAEGPTLHGVAKAVDAGKNSLTVALAANRRGEADEERTLAVAEDVVAVLDNGKGRRFSVKEGKLADVPVGAAVVVKLTPDQKAVAMIRAEGPSLVGAVKAVDAAKGTITVAQGRGRDNVEEKTLPVAGDARIMIDGVEGKIADIKVVERGPLAQLRLSLDQKTVQSIVIGGGRR